MKRVLLLLVLVGVFGAAVGAPVASGGNGKLLILAPTVTGGAASLEAQAAVAAGHGVDVVDAATWSAMTTAQFAQYDAIVLGDPTCEAGDTAVSAAIANRTVWSPAVTGNVLVIGTDPVYHATYGNSGAATLIRTGVAFAADAAGATGLYADLSCYYAGSPSGTALPLLDQLSPYGGFVVRGQHTFTGCPNDSHIVASHPALAGLTDADLSNWNCSAHEAFDSFPLDFAVLAISRDIGGTYVAPDGTVGGPYILARGKSLVVLSDISLAAASATAPAGTSEALTATVAENGAPISGTTVTFAVVAGPDAGTTGTGVTDASGVATWSYTGVAAGTDLVKASYVDSLGRTQSSTTVSVDWTQPLAADLSVTKAGPTSILWGQSATYTVSVANAGPAAASGVVVSDTITGGSFVSGSGPGGACALVLGVVSCPVGGLPVGGSATVTITVAGPAPGTLSDTAHVAGDQPDPVPANDDATASTAVLAHPTAITYTGPTTQSLASPVSLSASLSDTSTGTPVAGATVSLSLGTQSCTATTDASGSASCGFAFSQPAGTYTATASFAGTAYYLPSTTSGSVLVATAEASCPASGCTVSTGTAPTPANPTVAQLTLPPGGAGGIVAILVGPLGGGTTFCGGNPCIGSLVTTIVPGGYGLMNPVALTLLYDRSLLGKRGIGQFNLYKDNGSGPVLVPRCRGLGGDEFDGGDAAIGKPPRGPLPCLLTRKRGKDGSLLIRVLTSSVDPAWGTG